MNAGSMFVFGHVNFHLKEAASHDVTTRNEHPIFATAGYMICFFCRLGGKEKNLYDYPHWPRCNPITLLTTYREMG